MLKLESHKTEEIYTYTARTESEPETKVCIYFVDGEFHHADYDFGAGRFTLEQWDLLAEVNAEIVRLLKKKQVPSNLSVMIQEEQDAIYPPLTKEQEDAIRKTVLEHL